jgi:PAS domain S-box-containing protein
MSRQSADRQSVYACLSVLEAAIEPMTATEVATELSCPVEAAESHLRRLTDAGYLETKSVGPDVQVWWLADYQTRSTPATTEDAATVFERINEAFFALDEQFRFTYLNDRARRLIGLEGTDAIGTTVWELFPEAVGSEFQEAYEQAMETQTTVRFESYYEPLGTWFEVVAYPSESGLSVYFDDVTERVESQRDLERYRAVVETVADGIYVVDEQGKFTLVNEAYANLMGRSREELLGEHVSTVADEETLERAAELEDRLRDGEDLTASLTAELTDADGNSFVGEAHFALVPGEGDGYERVGVVRDVTERERQRERLADQRENLQALNDLNSLVRNIMESVLQQSTRREVEELLCERLAAADSYVFAWVGEVDPTTETVVPRVEAGTDGYAAQADISTAADDSRGEGPAGRAARTGEIQVEQHCLESDDFGPWADAAREYGFRSSASVPLSVDGTLYGLLNVYSARAGAFEDEERDALSELGAVVGQALASIDRRRALTSDEVVELEFTVTDVFAGLDVPTPESYRAIFDRIVPTGDSAYVAYVTADEGFLEVAETLIERFDTWRSVSVLDEDESGYRLELEFTDPVVPSLIADQGGYVRRVELDSGAYNATVTLPHSADVRQVLDRVREVYEDSTVVTNRRTTRVEDASKRITRAFEERLTDRQRMALEMAYFAGFFEWPRRSSGTDVAESMELHPSTFHQHLRHAEAALLSALFDEA